jgi:hypothetical protein
MSTITPTSDTRAWINGNNFQIGDQVQSTVDGRIGRITNDAGLIEVVISVDPITGIPVTQMQSPPNPPLPLATPSFPSTDNVIVAWVDGTQSTVKMSTLQRVP